MAKNKKQLNKLGVYYPLNFTHPIASMTKFMPKQYLVIAHIFKQKADVDGKFNETETYL